MSKVEKRTKAQLVERVNSLMYELVSWKHAFTQAIDCVTNLQARASPRRRFGVACGVLGIALGAFLTVLAL